MFQNIFLTFLGRDQYNEILRMVLHQLMKPNLYIYLDAPVDTVSFFGVIRLVHC